MASRVWPICSSYSRQAERVPEEIDGLAERAHGDRDVLHSLDLHGAYSFATPARAQSSSCCEVPPPTPQAPSTSPLRMMGTAPWPMIICPPDAAAIPRGVGWSA